MSSIEYYYLVSNKERKTFVVDKKRKLVTIRTCRLPGMSFISIENMRPADGRKIWSKLLENGFKEKRLGASIWKTK